MNLGLPNLLIVDGHSSRLSVETLMTAALNNVHILCLPSHLTHLLQPNDSGLNKLFKSELYACLRLAASHKIPQTFVQLTFHILCALAHDNMPSSIRNSFRHCGIWPFDDSKIATLLEKESASPDYCSLPQIALSVALIEERRDEGDRLRQEANAREKATPTLGRRRKRRFFSSSRSKVLTAADQLALIRLDETWTSILQMKAVDLHAYLVKNPHIFKDEDIYTSPATKRFRKVKDLEEIVYQALESQKESLGEVYDKWIHEKNVLLPSALISNSCSNNTEN